MYYKRMIEASNCTIQLDYYCQSLYMNGKKLPDECLFNPQAVTDKIEAILLENNSDKVLKDDRTYVVTTGYRHILRGKDMTSVISCETTSKAYKERILFYPYQALTVVTLMNIFENQRN